MPPNKCFEEWKGAKIFPSIFLPNMVGSFFPPKYENWVRSLDVWGLKKSLHCLLRVSGDVEVNRDTTLDKA